MSRAPLPRYPCLQDVPRDLRSAAELATSGYHDLGLPRAYLAQDGGDIALFSTAEARRRRDGMWPRSAAGREALSAGTDAVTARGRAPGFRDRAGVCRVCGRQAQDLVGGACPSCRPERRRTNPRGTAAAWLKELLQEDFAVLDTETTGLGRHDEIIEIGVVDASGTTLLEALVWPRSGRVPAGATRVHGLTLTDLEGAPTWTEVLPELEAALDGRRVLAWNAPFDERMVRQSSRLWHLQHRLPAFECAMRHYALARGVPSGRRKLADAAAEAGLLDGPQRHRSTDDARLTLALLANLER